MMELAEMEVALVSFSKQLAILQSYLSLKFGLEFQEFYDRSQRIIPGVGPFSWENEGGRARSGEESSSSRGTQQSTVPPIVTTGMMDDNQETRRRGGGGGDVGNEEPHSTMDVDEREGDEAVSRVKSEVEEGPAFVCVKEEEDDNEKITPDFEDEDPTLFTPNVSLTVRSGEDSDEEEESKKRTRNFVDEDPLAIVDYDKDGQTAAVVLGNAARGSRGKRQHRKESSDEDYQQEGDEGSSSDDDAFWVMTEAGPARAGAGGESNEHRPIKKCSKAAVASTRTPIEVKGKRGRKKGTKVQPHSSNVKKVQPHPSNIKKAQPRPPNIRSVAHVQVPLSLHDICSYCMKSLTSEDIASEQLKKDDKESTTSRGVCRECHKAYQSTAEKIKNLWSSIIPSAKKHGLGDQKS